MKRNAPQTFLRAAEAPDVPRLTEVASAAYERYIERMGYRPRPMTEDYADVLERWDVTVAEREGETVGLLVVGEDEEGYVIDNVAVLPGHGGSGIGRALLQHAEALARRAGFDSIYLYTHETMTENIDLYARIGYVEYARRPHRGFDLVFMRKSLQSSAEGARD